MSSDHQLRECKYCLQREVYLCADPHNCILGNIAVTCPNCKKLQEGAPTDNRYCMHCDALLKTN